jgi:hypothetical protein
MQPSVATKMEMSAWKHRQPSRASALIVRPGLADRPESEECRHLSSYRARDRCKCRYAVVNGKQRRSDTHDD